MRNWFTNPSAMVFIVVMGTAESMSSITGAQTNGTTTVDQIEAPNG